MKKYLLIILLTTCTGSLWAQTKNHKIKPAYQVSNKSISVYTTAENTDYRITKTATLTFKKFGQPIETEACIFVDPSKTFQSVLGIGGALTDASAETFYKLPKDKQQELLTAYYDTRKQELATPLARTQHPKQRFLERELWLYGRGWGCVVKII